jgi:hypothetical protein
MVRYGDLHMTTIAIAGFGYNGGQVIFKHQLDDPLYKNYKEAARTCACCCLPPPRVKISLHPGTCIVGGIDPGNAFNQTQKTTYRALVENKTEKVLSLTLDNIPCPQRSKWEYSLTFIPDGTDQPVSVILLVPTQQYYPKYFLLNCGSGSVDFVQFTKFPPARRRRTLDSPSRIPIKTASRWRMSITLTSPGSMIKTATLDCRSMACMLKTSATDIAISKYRAFSTQKYGLPAGCETE